MSEWVTIQLKELLTLKRGYDLPHSETKSGPYPVVASTNVRGYHNEYKVDGPVITVGRSGSIGHVQYIESKAWPLNTTLYMTDAKGNNKRFIYYFLKTIGLEQFNSGAGVPTLNRNHINLLKVKIPSNTIQTKIADVLSTYDKLIENNNRRIQILEQTAEELYKEWFVRMRFPGYEKTKFDKGIPEGWEVRRIGDFIDLKSGYAFKSSWWKKTGIPVVKIKDIQNNTLDFSALSYVSTENAEKSKQFYLSPGDLLIALTGATIGKIALVPYFAYDKLTVNQRVGKFFLGDKPIENVAFFYFLFLQTHIQEQIISIGNSNAAQPNISPLDIKNIKILYNETVIYKFNSSVKKYINLILKLKETNQNLIKQRDLLLPRLMNGTITVK